jgi:hypothetical protein
MAGEFDRYAAPTLGGGAARSLPIVEFNPNQATLEMSEIATRRSNRQ